MIEDNVSSLEFDKNVDFSLVPFDEAVGE